MNESTRRPDGAYPHRVGAESPAISNGKNHSRGDAGVFFADSCRHYRISAELDRMLDAQAIYLGPGNDLSVCSARWPYPFISGSAAPVAGVRAAKAQALVCSVRRTDRRRIWRAHKTDQHAHWTKCATCSALSLCDANSCR